MTGPEGSVSERIRGNLEELGLDAMASSAPEYSRLVATGAKSFPEALLEMTDAQVAAAGERDLGRRIEKASFPYVKTLRDFDFSFQPSIPRGVVEDLATLGLLERHENVVLVGSPGVGKTHIAVALGVEAIRARKLTYFTDCQRLVSDLAHAAGKGQLERRLRFYAHLRDDQRGDGVVGEGLRGPGRGVGDSGQALPPLPPDTHNGEVLQDQGPRAAGQGLAGSGRRFRRPAVTGLANVRWCGWGQFAVQSGEIYLDFNTGKGTPRQVESLLGYLEAEAASRDASKRASLLRRCALPAPKTFDGYDWSAVSWPDGFGRDDLLSLSFLGRREDLVLMGDVGTGKTHMASALCTACCQARVEARFFTASSLVVRLRRARDEGRLDRELAQVGRAELLVIDELGFLPLDADGARLLFQVVSAAHESQPVVFTTNLEFSRWGAVFGDDQMAAAVIDRVVHHGRLLRFRGESYRVRHALMQGGAQKG